MSTTYLFVLLALATAFMVQQASSYSVTKNATIGSETGFATIKLDGTDIIPILAENKLEISIDVTGTAEDLYLCLVREGVSVPKYVAGWSTGCHAFAIVPATPSPAPPVAPPTAAAPTAAAPTAPEPTAAPPTALSPTAAPPTTMAPPTAAPTTVAPPTAAPTTLAPPTAPPTTLAPPTAPPTTLAPPTPAPTAAPTPAPTAPPTTLAPPTAAPTTVAPPTAAPTTLAPPTAAPTTLAPPTEAPTPAPTAASPMAIVKRTVQLVVNKALNITTLMLESGSGSFTYELGITHVNSNATQEVFVTLTGQSCPGQYEVPPACVAATELGANTSATVPAQSSLYFYVNAPAKVGVVAITTTASHPVLFGAKYAGVPTATSLVTGTVVTQVPSAAEGLWFFEVANNGTTASDVSLALNATVCTEGIGPNCDTEFAWNTTDVAPGQLGVEGGRPLDPEAVQYLEFHSNGTLMFSVVEYPNGDGNPAFAARFGQLPVVSPINSKENDIVGCNTEGCEKGAPGFYDANARVGTWYLAVKNTGTESLNYVVWFNTVCGKNCAGQGTCNTEGELQGRCECDSKYEGIMCDAEKPIPFEYIVLIIIASLVVLSAIIGFIAWAYMRRKRIRYERVE